MGLSEWNAKNRFLDKRADFYDDLADALDDRASLAKEIEQYRNRTAERGDPGIAAIYNLWLRRLDRGIFSEAIKVTVPLSDSMILQSFESSGRLSEGLRFLAKTVRLTKRMRSTMIGAVLIPGFILAFISVLLAMVGYFMVPVLEQIYSHEKWPFAGQLLYPVAQFVKDLGHYALAVLILLAIAFKKSLPRWTGPRRIKWDNFPPYSIFRDYYGALFLTSLAAMLRSGMGITDALVALRNLASPWMRWHITMMIANLDRFPAEPAKALDTGCLPRAVADRIIDSGKRSSFKDAMSKIGMQSIEYTEAGIGVSAKVINNLMLIFAGMLLGLIIVGTVLTAMHAQEVIRQQIS